MNRATPLLIALAILATTAGAAEPPSLPWSLAPLKKPAPPTVKNTTWLKDGLATYDLTGLSTTPEEITAFVNDPAPRNAATPAAIAQRAAFCIAFTCARTASVMAAEAAGELVCPLGMSL